jgi:hypothetical protein
MIESPRLFCVHRSGKGSGVLSWGRFWRELEEAVVSLDRKNHLFDFGKRIRLFVEDFGFLLLSNPAPGMPSSILDPPDDEMGRGGEIPPPWLAHPEAEKLLDGKHIFVCGSIVEDLPCSKGTRKISMVTNRMSDETVGAIDDPDERARMTPHFA